MKRIRQWLVVWGITLALLIPFAGAASADPGDGGGFQDPLIKNSGVTVEIAAPGNVTVTTKPGTINTAADPGDGGGF